MKKVVIKMSSYTPKTVILISACIAVPHMEYTDQQSGWDYYNLDPAVCYYPPLNTGWIGGHHHGYHNQPAVPFQFGNNFPTG